MGTIETPKGKPVVVRGQGIALKNIHLENGKCPPEKRKNIESENKWQSCRSYIFLYFFSCVCIKLHDIALQYEYFYHSFTSIHKSTNCVLYIYMFSFQVWSHIRRPVGVVIGMLSQFFLLPLAAFSIIILLRLDPLYATGMLVLACSPGGVTSNIFSYFCDGDISLR